jgi:hypothetical protein
VHEIEPHYRWRDDYTAEEDPKSPFYGRRGTRLPMLYNFVLNPEWDYFGSSTLYMKILFADYDEGYVMIELIGEWNDILHNDIMLLKRKIVEPLLDAGISHFVFFCENLLNFHADQDDDYYAEWHEEVSDRNGWIAFVNIRKHIEEEMQEARMEYYCQFGPQLNDINWRPYQADHAFGMVEERVLYGAKMLY